MVDTPTPTPTPPVNQNITQWMAQQATNPSVSNAAELVPVLQNTNETFLQNSGQLTGQNVPQIGAQGQLNVPNQTGVQTSAQPALNQITSPNGTQITASQVDPTQGQGTAEQMTVGNLSTVRGQLNDIYANMAPGEIPQWAQASVAAANEVLGARGLKPNSSIGFAALQGAVQQQAVNIAAADAATYFKADLANFDARQQTNMANIQFRQQALFTNTAAENSAKQINAQSEQQTQQFMASLVASVQEANANRMQAADKSNIDNNLAAQTFYQQQEFNRQKFNSEQQFAIDQSNVLWRRNLNTANTASVNAANQFNTQNRFNLSATAMNNLWQQFRDEAAWAFTASENQRDRDYNVAIAANNINYLENASDVKWYENLGGFAASLFFSK